jgi:hypothetical protein
VAFLCIIGPQANYQIPRIHGLAFSWGGSVYEVGCKPMEEPRTWRHAEGRKYGKATILGVGSDLFGSCGIFKRRIAGGVST